MLDRFFLLPIGLSAAPLAWLAVVGLGCYHGLNPGMGWLLAVSNGLQARRGQAVFAAFLPIGAGHFLAMAAALLPFAVLSAYFSRLHDVSIAAGLVLVAFGLLKLIRRRHPRFLARIRPHQIALWSALMATAHGAGLMLLPAFLALCSDNSAAHGSVLFLLEQSTGAVVAVALVHTAAMLAVGSLMAWLVYRFWGLRVLQRSWFNLDLVWATALLLSGSIALAS